jgi:hypothetical protein
MRTFLVLLMTALVAGCYLPGDLDRLNRRTSGLTPQLRMPGELPPAARAKPPSCG